MARKKIKKGEQFARDAAEPRPEGEWDRYELIRDEAGGEDESNAAVDRWAEPPESYDQSVGSGEAGLSDGTRRLSEGPEGHEPSAKFDFPDEDSGFETHDRAGDEAGLSPSGSENWTRQEYGALAEDAFDRSEDEPAEVPVQGTPTKELSKAALGDTPAYSYTNQGAAKDYGRFYTSEDQPPTKSYAGSSRSDEEIYREITARLPAEPDVNISDLEVEVSDGQVTLRGKVDSRLPEYLVSALVERVPGVRDIRDEIELS